MAQQASSDTIRWRPGYKLTLEDFHGIPEKNSRFAAVSWTGPLVTSRFATDTSLKFNVYCVFYRDLSWIKRNIASDELLAHEQGHFDIAEICSRKLRILLKPLEKINYIKYESILKERKKLIIEEIMKEKDSLDKVYDLETNLSRDSVQQKVWSLKIEEMLFEVSADTIQWRPDYKLKPDDFQGDMPSNTDFSAISKVLIRYIPIYSSNGKTEFKVACFFTRSGSWITDQKDSTYLLRHEQGHFDLAEVYSRKLKKRLDSLVQKKLNDNEVLIQAKRIFDKTLMELNSVDEQYDSETNYSIDRNKQQFWLRKIEAMLAGTE